jgi:2-polyprenyl-3-methyl-5-hydroxy-6-metoxy-1,4-benzoquinol methylase
MRHCNICNNSNNCKKIVEIKLNLINDINLNSNLIIYYCYDCYFYFTDSNNSQENYNQYYLNFNNYKENVIINDKDNKCYNFLINYLDKETNIIDFGCGNSELFNIFKQNNYSITSYDIDNDFPSNKYNCIILSHVLEHIFDIDNFIIKLDSILNNNNGMIYIEIPNAEFYHLMNDICPLQEINIEHINFFTKFALNKLMIKHNYYEIYMKLFFIHFIIEGLQKLIRKRQLL